MAGAAEGRSSHSSIVFRHNAPKPDALKPPLGGGYGLTLHPRS